MHTAIEMDDRALAESLPIGLGYNVSLVIPTRSGPNATASRARSTSYVATTTACGTCWRRR